MPDNSAPLDILSTSFLISGTEVFFKVIAKFDNISFSQAIFPERFKKVQITTLPKRHGMNDADPASCL